MTSQGLCQFEQVKFKTFWDHFEQNLRPMRYKKVRKSAVTELLKWITKITNFFIHICCQNIKQLCLKPKVELKMVWMSPECETSEAVQSSGRAELDELGPGTGDKGIQKCVIAWLRWRVLDASWCFSDFVRATSAFTPIVPKLRVLLQIHHEFRLLTNWILVVQAKMC